MVNSMVIQVCKKKLWDNVDEGYNPDTCYLIDE